MSKIKKFEDILAWQKARKLVDEIYRLTNEREFCNDFYLKDQVRRASASIMLNIAEGFGRNTNKEFALFLFHAHGSAAETQSALYIALDRKYISEKDFTDLYNNCSEISKMITGLIKYLKSFSK